MTVTGHLDSGEAITLGAVLASAGEGTIYEIVGHPEWVAKIFHSDLNGLAAKLAKVAAMVLSPPEGALQSDGFVVLTWPLHMVTLDGGDVGYVMPRIDTGDAVEIHTVSNPSNRMNPLPSAPQWTPHASWRHLVNVAANLCLAVETVHDVDAVIGDFQERNILVSDTTRVTLVDVDSMQFIDDDGESFLCGVGRPEFTAPELADVDLKTAPRQKFSDFFALAVHIHLLLMAGNHPFLRGEWTGDGDQPDAMTLARSGEWAGGPGSRLRTHPLAPPITFLPPEIERLFIQAFTDGARDPSRRPTAAEWRRALLDVRVATCPRGHQIPLEADPCPWCSIDDERARRKAQRAKTSVAAPAQTILRAEAPVSATASSAVGRQYPVAAAKASADTGIRVIVSIAVAVVAVIGLLIAVIVKLAGGSDNAATDPSTPASATAQTPPPDARQCGSASGGYYRWAAAGTDITSCPFALNVAAAVNSSGHFPYPPVVDAYSPVTKQVYTMRCAIERVLTCRGGNDAVVYVY